MYLMRKHQMFNCNIRPKTSYFALTPLSLTGPPNWVLLSPDMYPPGGKAPHLASFPGSWTNCTPPVFNLNGFQFSDRLVWSFHTSGGRDPSLSNWMNKRQTIHVSYHSYKKMKKLFFNSQCVILFLFEIVFLPYLATHWKSY